MKKMKIFAAGCAAMVGLAACVNESQSWEEAPLGQGTTSIEVETLKPTPTRAVDAQDFPVAVKNKATNETVQEFLSAALVPNTITLPVGIYYAEAHTPGELQRIMTEPYYLGCDEFEILSKINTRSNVICRMANGRINVALTDEFKAAFSQWTITVDDGGNPDAQNVISFSNEKGDNQPLYVVFAENTSQLTVNFTGTTTAGNRVSATNILNKKQASEVYDSDSDDFAGGDAIQLDFTLVESTEGSVTGINLTANISFEETEEVFQMEVEDKPFTPDDDDTPGTGGNTPGDTSGDENAITLQLPENMIVTYDTNPTLGNTYIAADAGIKSIRVKITSDSEDFLDELTNIAEMDTKLDFVSGAEVIENHKMEEFFASIGQTIAVPSIGSKEFMFPIGNFFMMLTVLPGIHNFELQVTDVNGVKKIGVITLTVNEE